MAYTDGAGCRGRRDAGRARRGRRKPLSGPPAWADAVETLADLIEDYQAWRDNLPGRFGG